MEFATLILLIIIGFVLYNIFSKKPNKKVKNRHHQRGRYVPNRAVTPNRTVQPNHSALLRDAQRQVSRGNFDDASDLYLRANQVFTAAKMKLFKGPQAAAETISLIKINAPNRYNIILDNLVNEFYYRLKKPNVSIALLREAGFHERAEAIAVASGLLSTQPSQTQQTMQTHSQTEPVATKTVVTEEKFDIDGVKPVKENELDDFLDTAITEVNKPKAVIKEKIPNSLLMASGTISDNCVVCRKSIDSGDTFIYCLNCGKPGHYKHLAEMVKVTGRCPSCKQSLKIRQYDLDG